MIDKNGKKLLKSSPLKWLPLAISAGAGIIQAFSGYNAKKKASNCGSCVKETMARLEKVYKNSC